MATAYTQLYYRQIIVYGMRQMMRMLPYGGGATNFTDATTNTNNPTHCRCNCVHLQPHPLQMQQLSLIALQTSHALAYSNSLTNCRCNSLLTAGLTHCRCNSLLYTGLNSSAHGLRIVLMPFIYLCAFANNSTFENVKLFLHISFNG